MTAFWEYELERSSLIFPPLFFNPPLTYANNFLPHFCSNRQQQSHFLGSYQEIQTHGDTKMHQVRRWVKEVSFLGIYFTLSPPTRLLERESSLWCCFSPGGGGGGVEGGGSDRSWWVIRVINCSSIPLGHLHPENNFFLLYSPETRVWPLTSPRHFLGLRHLQPKKDLFPQL